MKGMSARSTKGIQVGSTLKCVDNTGAKLLQVISVRGFHGVRKRLPKAGIGDIVTCAVKKGVLKMRHEVVIAVIIRQRKEYRRPNGVRIAFADNAAVLMQENLLEPRGKELKGAIAKEAAERFPTVGKIASIVI